MRSLPKTAAEARLLKSKRYFTGKECRNGHISERVTHTCNCVDCTKEIKRRAYQRNKNNYEFITKGFEYRSKNKSKKNEYDKERHKKNRAENIIRARQWVKDNPEKRAAIVFNYDAKRRTLKKSGVGAADIRKWKESQSKICYWCDKGCKDDYHIDHYMPLSKGGAHEIDNLVISCPPCNLSKNAKLPHEWMKELKGKHGEVSRAIIRPEMCMGEL